MRLSGRFTSGWHRRAWTWCTSAAKSTWSLWRASLAFLLRDPWKPLALIAVLVFLPAIAMRRTAQSTAFLSLVRNLICAPLLFASLARLHLATLRGERAALIGTVVAKAKQWRELLTLLLVGAMLEQLGSFATGLISQLVFAVLSLINWIPGIGTVLDWLFSALITLFVMFVSLVCTQAIYFVWLRQETQATSFVITLSATWRFLRARMRTVVGLYCSLALVQCALWFAFSGIQSVGWVLWPLVESLLMWLGTSYAVVLFSEDRNASGPNPYSAPVDLDHMKRANIPEE